MTKLANRSLCRPLSGLLFAVAGGLMAGPCWGADFTWAGGTPTANWGDMSNWAGGVIPPTNGVNTNVFMQGPGGISDLADAFDQDDDWHINSLTFEATTTGTWNLTGGQLTVDDFINNKDEHVQVFNNARVNVGTGPILSLIASSGDLVFNSAVYIPSNDKVIRVAGGNSVFFNIAIQSPFGLGVDNASLSIEDGSFVHMGAKAVPIGNVEILDGTLQMGTTNALFSESSKVNISSGATFDLNGFDTYVGEVNGAGTILLGGADLIVNQSSGTRTFGGNIQESGRFDKRGDGTLVINGTNNTMTNLQISDGIVQVNNAGAFGSNTTIAAGTLQTTATMTSIAPITLHAFTHPFFVNTIDVDNATTFTQSGIISGLGGGFFKAGNGTLVLGAANTYTGSTDILDGTLSLSAANRIDDNSGINLTQGATLELNKFSETVRNISGTGGSVATGGSGGRLTVNDELGTHTYNGTFTGEGGFDKQGGHFLILGGNNTNSGATNITGGTLRLSGAGSLGNDSDVTVSNATWDLNNIHDTVDSISGNGSILLGSALLTVDEPTAATRTFSGTISGTGGLRKNGAHTLVLSGNNTFSGELSIAEGTLSVSASINLGATSSSLVFFGGTLQSTASFSNQRDTVIGPFASANFNVNTATTLTQSGAITGDSTTTLGKIGSGTLRLTGASAATFTGDVTISSGTLDLAGPSGTTLGNSTKVTLDPSGTLLVNSPTDLGGLAGSGPVVLNQLLNVGFDNASTTYSGQISGTAGFGKRGTGTLTLSGTNTYTGATDIDIGILQLSGAGQLNSSTDVDVAAGATFDLNNVSVAIDSLTGAGAIMLGGGVNTLTIGSDNGSGTFSGNISETGALTKVGSGIQTLSGNNTFSSFTSFDGGVLRTNGTANLGSGQLSFGGGTWEITGSFTNPRPILVDLGVEAIIDVDSGVTLTQSGTMFGSLSTITKADTGTLLLTAASSPQNMNVNGGLLQFAGSGSLSNSTRVSVASGAIWDLNGIDDTVASIAGGGQIQLNGLAALTVAAASGDTHFSGIISGTGILNKDGNHRLRLSGTNTYSAGTRINGGVLQIDSDANLGNLGSPLIINNGTLQTDLSLTINRNVYLDANFGTIYTSGGTNNTAISGIVEGAGTLIKSGNATAGSLSLSGSNIYTGGTIVEAGTLSVSSNLNLGANSGSVTLVDNSRLEATGTFTNQHALVLDNSGEVSVLAGQTLTQAVGISGTGALTKIGSGKLLLNAAATHIGDTVIAAGALGGDGSVSGLVVVNPGAIIMPGNSIGASTGVLTVDSVLLSTSSRIEIDLAGAGGVAGTDYDQLVVNNTATINSAILAVNLLGGYVPAAGDQFQIFNYGGTVDGLGIFVLELPTLSTSLAWETNQLRNTGMLSVVTSLQGDYNGDGTVDAADYTIWRDTNGSMGPGLAADGNGDMMVDSLDNGIWRANFGSTAGSLLAPGESPGIIPEPASLATLVLALFIVGLSRRPERKHGVLCTTPEKGD